MKSRKHSPSKSTDPGNNSTLLPRPRLFKKLDRCFTSSATWITGPAGSGKTSLIRSFLESRGCPAIWHHMDNNTRNAADFFHDLSFSAQEMFSTGIKLPHVSPESSADLPSSARRFFKALAGDSDQPVTIVFDNYHEVPPRSALHTMIRDVLSVISRHARFIFISRNHVPEIFTEVETRHRDMRCLDWHDIRFTENETEKIIHAITHRKYDKKITRQIYGKTDGWVSGVILILKRAQIENIPARFLGQYIPKEVFDYFNSEIFDCIDENLKMFLLATSFFPEMTIHMANKIAGVENSHQIFSNLEKAHFFINQRTGREPYYSYHPLFSEYLKDMVNSFFSTKKTKALKNKAAGLLAEDGRIDIAVDLYRESGNMADLLELINTHAYDLISGEKCKIPEEWFKNIHPNIYEKNPWLLYWYAGSVLHANPSDAFPLFERAHIIFKNNNDVKGVLLSLCGIFDTVLLAFNSFKQYDDWLPAGDFFLKGINTCATPVVKAKAISVLYNAYVCREPSHPNLAKLETLAQQMIHQDFELFNNINMALGIFNHKVLTGDIPEARSRMAQCKKLTRLPETKPLFLILTRGLECLYYWFRGEHDRCINRLSDTIKIATDTGCHFFTPLAQCIGCAQALMVDNHDLAEKYMKELEIYINFCGHLPRGFFHLLKLWKSLTEKDFHHAALYADFSCDEISESGATIALSIVYLGKAFSLRGLDKNEAADVYLEKALNASLHHRIFHVEFGCYLAQAEFAMDDGDEESAVSAIKKAIALGKKKHLFGTFFINRERWLKICAKALSVGIKSHYLNTLIKKYDLSPLISCPTTLRWPWPIQIYTLGEFSVIINGGECLNFGKTAKKTVSLLKALVVAGRNDIHEYMLQDMLWPDTEGDHAGNVFSTTLHRLRKLLGTHDAILMSQGKITLNEKLCWVDVWFYENRLNQALDLWENKSDTPDLEQAIHLTEKLISARIENFLPDDDDLWLIPVRDRLKNKISMCIENIGQYYEETSQYHNAICAYRKGIEIDPFSGIFYKNIILCHNKTGDISEAISAYRHFKKIHHRILGIEPGLEFKKIYHSIIENPYQENPGTIEI